MYYLCLPCVPYAAGVWCVLCVFAVHHSSVTPSRTGSSLLQRETPSTDAYTIHFRLVFVPFLVPRGSAPRIPIFKRLWKPRSTRIRYISVSFLSCTPGLILHFHFTAFKEIPTCEIRNGIQRPTAVRLKYFVVQRCGFLPPPLLILRSMVLPSAGATSRLSLDCSPLWRRLPTACTSTTTSIGAPCLTSTVRASWYVLVHPATMPGQ